MKVEILRCRSCKEYSLKKKCEHCDNACVSPKPAKFSIEDKWGKYRRIYKLQQRAE
ncbi:MAG: nucleolar RNA-binding Nop10p family protein [Nanoarchaeota archaeon]